MTTAEIVFLVVIGVPVGALLWTMATMLAVLTFDAVRSELDDWQFRRWQRERERLAEKTAKKAQGQ